MYISLGDNMIISNIVIIFIRLRYREPVQVIAITKYISRLSRQNVGSNHGRGHATCVLEQDPSLYSAPFQPGV